MATETFTTSDLIAGSLDWENDVIHSLMSMLVSWDRASCQEFLIKYYSGLITNSIMLSQTAADVHVILEAIVRSYRTIDFTSRGRMKKVMERIVERGSYHHVSTFLDYLRRSLDSDDGDCIRAIILRGERAVEGLYKNETCDGAFPSQHSQHALTVAVAAVLHLLAFIFQYLIGTIDRGGTKTYSSGCFDFRASFVSVLLFLAAFVWIKFRQAARPPTGKRKARSTQLDHPGDDSYDPSRVCVRGESKFEARFTIPMDIDKAHPVKDRRLSLGVHNSREKAACVSRVAQSYYEDERGACCVKLKGYQFEFFVPPMREEERGLVGEEKKKSVMKHAKDKGTKMYEEYAKLQLAVATGTGSSNPSSRSLSFQPSLMRGQTADEPLYLLDDSLYSGPLLSPRKKIIREKLNPGSQPFQLEHQGPAQGFEGPVSSEGVDVQWPEGQPPPNGMQTEYSHEELMTLCGPVANDFTFEQVFPFNCTMLFSDSAALLEDDNSHIFGGEAATVEPPQLWSVQTFQQGRAAGDALEQYADRCGSDPIVVEQSQLVPQFFSVQSRQVDHLQGTESQLAEPSQQMPNGWGEPSESMPQRNEPLHKELERLRKEKELSEQDNERLRKEKELSEQENERLRKEKELCEQEIERLLKEKELSDEEKERLLKEKELSDEEKERLLKEKELSDEEKERLLKEKEVSEQENQRLRKEKELSDEKKERFREENKRLSDAIFVLVAPKSK